MPITADQRRALVLLAAGPHGCTLAITLAHGFRRPLLNGLMSDSLVTAEPGTIRASERQFEVMWLTITDAGRSPAMTRSGAILGLS